MAEQSKERYNQEMMFDQYLGHLDLEKHPRWELAWNGQDQKVFEEILHDMGADLAYGYDFRVCHYRPRTGKQSEYGVRVGFKERTDSWWRENMMDVTDLTRYVSENEGTVRAVGMIESLLTNGSVHQAMAEAAERIVVNADIVVDDGKDMADIVDEVKE